MPHRRIYREHYGPIPREPSGKSYHIHHIDGDHTNNDPKNLVALTAREHFDRHYAQGDYQAALRLAENIHLTYNEQSELATLANHKRIAEGRHNWARNGESQRGVQEQLIAEGRHNFARMQHPGRIELSCRECRAIIPITNYRKHNSKAHGITLQTLSTGSRHSRRRATRGQNRTRNGLLPL
jgi:hypothetical protein